MCFGTVILAVLVVIVGTSGGLTLVKLPKQVPACKAAKCVIYSHGHASIAAVPFRFPFSTNIYSIISRLSHTEKNNLSSSFLHLKKQIT